MTEMKKDFTLIAAIFFSFLVGCQKKAAPSLQWPATVSAMGGLSSEESSLLYGYIDELNSELSDKLLITTTDTSGATIQIVKVNSLGSKSATNAFFSLSPSTFQTDDRGQGTQVAGRATLEEGSCRVELASFLFSAIAVQPQSANGLIKSVLWHELGHCGGLDHTANSKDLMYKQSFDFSNYSDQALHHFFNDFVAATSVNG
jgi:hypothetical protein